MIYSFTTTLKQNCILQKTLKSHLIEKKDGRYDIMFSPSLNYPESVAFFSKNISPDDWEIEESISEKTEGERDSKWNLRGHQVKVRLDITTFGGEEGFGTSGYYHIERVDN